MFTLEDVDLTTELEFFREHGTDVMHRDGAGPTGIADEEATVPEADVRLHPQDYFIAGL